VTAAGSSYKGFRFRPEIISHCVWLYHRFPLSFRDVQELTTTPDWRRGRPTAGVSTCRRCSAWPTTA